MRLFLWEVKNSIFPVSILVGGNHERGNMNNYYSSEESVLELIALMKAHGIRKVIVSPGTTNITFVGSLQTDPYFQVYSCVDERSAAYMACGLAEESDEPVALSCTGATASRNYPSGLTEAFYRKLPILAITSSQPFGRVGQHFPQFTDRNSQFNDIVSMSVQIPYPFSDEERWSNNVKINNALLQLRRHGGSPVHINLETRYSKDFSVKRLPDARVIRRFMCGDSLPDIMANRICIVVGAHKKFQLELQKEIDSFCENYNAIVLCDQTSNYKGKYRVLGGLVTGQREYFADCRKCEIVIHLGEISGAYFSFNNTKVWRVNADGEVRDTFKLLENVFEMEELDFFRYYNSKSATEQDPNTYYQEWMDEINRLDQMIGELPLSNVWMCKQTAYKLPDNAVLYLSILNSLRSWSLYDTPNSVYSYSNVGGFGIDGGLSSCIGASLNNKDKLFFCVIGDLAMFYDLNIMGNRDIGNNVRILLSNNGTGYEMHCANSNGLSFDSEERDRFFCAGGHNGKQSRKLMKHFAEDLGFEYMSAETKKEYLEKVGHFVDSRKLDRPILFEVFVDVKDDDVAYNATKITMTSVRGSTKKVAKAVLGEKGVNHVKQLLKK